MRTCALAPQTWLWKSQPKIHFDTQFPLEIFQDDGQEVVLTKIKTSEFPSLQNRHCCLWFCHHPNRHRYHSGVADDTSFETGDTLYINDTDTSLQPGVATGSGTHPYTYIPFRPEPVQKDRRYTLRQPHESRGVNTFVVPLRVQGPTSWIRTPPYGL